jgi:hypothetical protein
MAGAAKTTQHNQARREVIGVFMVGSPVNLLVRVRPSNPGPVKFLFASSHLLDFRLVRRDRFDFGQHGGVKRTRL